MWLHVNWNGKVTSHDLINFLCFFVLLYPPGLQNWKPVFYYYLTMLNCLFFFIRLLLHIKNQKKDGYLLLLLILLGWFTLIELFKSPDDLFNFFRTLFVAALEGYFYFSWLPKRKNNSGIRSLTLLCKILLIVNFITVVLFPFGLFISSRDSSVERVQWLFGSKNNMSVYLAFTLAITFLSLYFECQKGKKNYWKYIMYSFMALYPAFVCGETGVKFMGGSSSAIVGVFVLVALGFYLMFVQDKKNRFLNKIVNPTTIITIILIAHTIVIFGESFSLIGYVSNLLGKDVTFSNRTYVWQSALIYIRQSLFLGYGEKDLLLSLGGNHAPTTYLYNCLLKVTINYGIIGLGILILLLYQIPRIKSDNVFSSLIVLGMSAVLIIGMMNEVDYFFLIAFGGIARYYTKILDNDKRGLESYEA